MRQTTLAPSGRILRARVRARGNGDAYVQVSTHSESGAHVATIRKRLAGSCLCDPGPPIRNGEWTAVAVPLDRILDTGTLAGPRLLISVEFHVASPDRTLRLGIDDVSLVA